MTMPLAYSSSSASATTAKADPYTLSIDPFFSLPITVQNKFNDLFQSTTVTKKNLVKRVYSSLLEFPEAVQLDIVDTFKSSCLKNTFLQKSVLFMDILKQRDFQRIKTDTAVSSSNNDSLNQLGVEQSQSSSQSSSQSATQNQKTISINALFQPKNQNLQASSQASSQATSQATSQAINTLTEQNMTNIPASQESQAFNQQTPDGMKNNAEYDSGNSQSPLEKTSFQIPEQLVGYVIGKGGKIIANIRNRSGAQIKISDRIDGHDSRSITVIGGKSQLEMAVEMMNEQICSERQEQDRDHGDRNDRRNRYNKGNSHGGQRSSGGYGTRRGRDWRGDYGDYHQQRPNRRGRFRY